MYIISGHKFSDLDATILMQVESQGEREGEFVQCGSYELSAG